MEGSRNPNVELGFRSISSILFLLLLASFPLRSESSCRGCKLAIGSYYIPIGSEYDNLTIISSLFDQLPNNVLPYNPNITNKDSIHVDSRINISFSCDCLSDDSLGHKFYYETQRGDTYTSIASTVYANLTTVAALKTFNTYSANNIPESVDINVTVSCFCGDADVSREYGLFVTYPLRPGENLSTVAADWGFSGQESLLQRYNQDANFSAGEGIVYIPTKGQIFI